MHNELGPRKIHDSIAGQYSQKTPLNPNNFSYPTAKLFVRFLNGSSDLWHVVLWQPELPFFLYPIIFMEEHEKKMSALQWSNAGKS